MKTIPIIDMSRATVSRDGKGAIMISQVDAPIAVVVRVESGEITSMTIVPRGGHQLTATGLGRIPLGAIRRLVRMSRHPNDLIWQHSVTQRECGERSWPEDHWLEVHEVYLWARRTKRPGGATGAIADLWGVSRYPTAKRWINETLRRVRDGRLSSTSD